ncbi:hypothetical protein EG832_17080, partial [bacterium]|nr:hypothetical protein [bacterium]
MIFDSEKMKEQLLQRQAESFLRSLEYRILRQGANPLDWDRPFAISSLIDRIDLVGDLVTGVHDLKVAEELFYPMHPDETFVPAKRMPHYGKRLNKDCPECKISIFKNASDYRPPFRMEIYINENTQIQQFRERLEKISQSLPDLKLSRVEYALDLYCTDPSGVYCIFKALKKHLFRPYKRIVLLLGKGKQEWGDDTRMNAYYRLGDAKIYERGPEKKRKNKAWVLKDADRIRLEYTATRKTLVKNGLHVFGDFMTDPKFYAINKDIYRFKCFKGSKKLPGYGKPYAAC